MPRRNRPSAEGLARTKGAALFLYPYSGGAEPRLTSGGEAAAKREFCEATAGEAAANRESCEATADEAAANRESWCEATADEATTNGN